LLLEVWKSLEEERYVRERFPNVVSGVTYWPTLLVKEGYWFSPWSKPVAVERIFNEIEARKDKSPLRVMLDLEPPAQVNPRLLVKGISTFEQTKARIERFVKGKEKYGIDLICTEAPTIEIPESVQKLFGLAFDPVKADCEVTKMVYTSWAQIAEKYLGKDFSRNAMVSLLRDEIRRGVQRYGDRFSIGLGLIAPGVIGSEPILPVEQLEQELAIAKKMGVQKAYIFRLKGVTEECGRVLRRFSD
jgi:hypothetical protein